jgi:hypothetical protein
MKDVSTALGPTMSYLKGTSKWGGGGFSGVEWLEHEIGHPPSSSAEVKNVWTFSSAAISHPK